MDVIQSLVTRLFRWVFRLVLLAFGLLFAAGVIAFLLALAGLWGLRAVWAKLTGRQVSPWVVRVSPREAFSRFAQRPGMRSAHGAHPGQGDPASPQTGRHLGDVTDVEVKPRP